MTAALLSFLTSFDEVIIAIFVSGGPMEAGVKGDKKYDLIDAMVMAADDKASDEEVASVERSARQFIEFAVNSPEQEPHVGQLTSSNSLSCSSEIVPF